MPFQPNLVLGDRPDFIGVNASVNFMGDREAVNARHSVSSVRRAILKQDGLDSLERVGTVLVPQAIASPTVLMFSPGSCTWEIDDENKANVRGVLGAKASAG